MGNDNNNNVEDDAEVGQQEEVSETGAQEPEAVEPVDPATVKPVDPATVKPVDPATVKPVEPATVKPVEPAAAKKNAAANAAAGSWTPIVFAVFFWSFIVLSFGYNYFGFGDPELEIVVAASPANVNEKGEPEYWSVDGHLIFDDRFVSGLGVWAIATDQQGNRTSTGKALTDNDGKFSLAKIPNSVTGEAGNGVVEIAIHVRGEVSGTGDEADEKIQVGPSSTRIGIGTEQRFRIISLPVKEMLIIASIFALSVAIALIPVPEGTRTTAWLVVKYLSSVVMAFLLTIFMILYISLGLRQINLTASNIENEVLSLGMANVFRGRYVDDVQDEWLISLTSPSFARASTASSSPQVPEPSPDGNIVDQDDDDAPPDPAGVDQRDTQTAAGSGSVTADPPTRELERGFGAPLWVLLVAVIGAALFTITIILEGIKEAPLQLSPKEIRQRIQTVVLHQFYILFSPVGAIFVYQLLVIAGAASQTATVAVVVLAAGIALNLLLEKARQSIKNVFSSVEVPTP